MWPRGAACPARPRSSRSPQEGSCRGVPEGARAGGTGRQRPWLSGAREGWPGKSWALGFATSALYKDQSLQLKKSHFTWKQVEEQGFVDSGVAS